MSVSLKLLDNPEKRGEVNAGDHVIFLDKSKNLRRIGKYESLYDNKMNVRLLSDNQLITLPLDEVMIANEQVVKTYYDKRTKEELVEEINKFKEPLEKFGLVLELHEKKA